MLQLSGAEAAMPYPIGGVFMGESTQTWLTALILLFVPLFLEELNVAPYWALVFVAAFFIQSVVSWLKTKSERGGYMTWVQLLLIVVLYTAAVTYSNNLDVIYALILLSSAGAISSIQQE